MAKKALITGITGQDGAYLAELLLEKGYEVHGIKRRASLFNTNRIDHLYRDPHERDVRLRLHYGDLTDATNLVRVIQQVQPDEIYNLAAQSHVAVSFETPEYTANSDALGTLRILEAIRILGLETSTRFYQASTSEMYGKVRRDAAEGDHAVLSALAVRRGQGVRVLDHGQLPRGLRPLCLQRHPVQPRVAGSRRDVRHAQDHARPRPHPRGARRLPVPRQHRRAARLGPRPRLRAGAVAHAAAGRSGGLRDCDGRTALGPRIRRDRRGATSVTRSNGADAAWRRRASTASRARCW